MTILEKYVRLLIIGSGVITVFNVKEITDKELVIHWSKYLKITRVETEYASLVRNEVEAMREAIETAIAVPTEKVEIEEEEE